MLFDRSSFVLAFIFCSISAGAQPRYLDVSAAVGLAPDHQDSVTCPSRVIPVENGSAWGDYDNDGDSDLFLTNGNGPSRFYQNNGDIDQDGLPDFSEIGTPLGLDDPDNVGHSAIFIDYDNDGDQDLFVTKWGLNTMYQNQLIETGSATFVDVTPVTGLDDDGRTVTSAWGDFDEDGFLDVYLAKHLYCDDDPRNDDQLLRNNGDGSFSDVTSYLCPGGIVPCEEILGSAFSAAWVDYDNDGDPDLYVANEYPQTVQYPNILRRNDGPDGSGGWIFTDVSMTSGAGTKIKSMGLGVGDFDNNGFYDFAVSNVGPNLLLKANGDGTYDDISESAGIERTWIVPEDVRSITWGVAFFDYNNDRLPDLLYVAGPIGRTIPQPNAFFENNGDLTFTDISDSNGLGTPSRARTISQVDLDSDGFVDIFVGQIGRPPLMFHNQGMVQGNLNHWLTVTAEGTVSNRDAIGTRVTVVTSDGVTQIRDITSGPSYGGGDERAARFGLGSFTEADLTVRWPTGVTDSIGTVSADQIIHLVEEPPGGIPCEEIDYFAGRCVGGTIQAIVRLMNSTQYAGEDVEFMIDSLVYPVTLVSKGLHSVGKLSVSDIATGEHTALLVTPAGCVDTISFVCSAARLVQDEFDRAWAETENWNEVTEPVTTELRGNYPNPFNPSTKIHYTLGSESHVLLRVYTMLGQVVTTLVDEVQQKGDRAITWNGRSSSGTAVSAGVYLYTLQTRDYSQTGKMVILK